MKKKLISAMILASVPLWYGCKEKNETLVLTKEITFTKEGELSLKKTTNDSLLAQLDIEIAETDYETQTGLMYRKSMQKNHGMLFIFERENIKSFYMKNTEFPLDIIYINAAMEVVSIRKNAKPFDKTSLPSEAPSKYVLEVNAGQADQWGLAVGDKVSFTREK